MPRPLSQLVYNRIQAGPDPTRIVTLHRHNQHAGDAAPLGIAAAPNGHVLALQSYKGVYVGRSVVGYTWYIGPRDRPSPIFFGDALAEIERFLWDDIDRQPGPDVVLPYLIGEEQGATMAIAAAAAVPDLISGIIAIEPRLPVVPGWDPPLAPLDGLPVLLVEPEPEHPAAGVLTGDALCATLGAWGGDVTSTTSREDIASWLAALAYRTCRKG
jgi:hypothetical protein